MEFFQRIKRASLRQLWGLILCLISLPMHGDDGKTPGHWGFSTSAVPATVVGMDQYVRKWLKQKSSFSIDLQANYASLPIDSNAFDRDYNYPELTLGLRYSINDVTMHREKDPAWGQLVPVDYTSHLGNIVSLYAAFTRSIWRSKHWEMDYSFAAGLAYAGRKYSLADNADDEFVGSHCLMYFGAGVHGIYWPADSWGIRVGLEFFHQSNGALYRPNKGVNYLGPSVGLVYKPARKHVMDYAHSVPKLSFHKYFSLDLAIGFGAKTLNEEWQRTQFGTSPDSPDYRSEHFHIYPTYSFSTHFMYRYARRWGGGIGADVFYGTYSKRIEVLDEAEKGIKHSPWSIGISARHAVYYHNFSLDLGLGFYLFRRMGVNAKEVETPYYEHIGIHYTMPFLGNVQVGVNVKAHLTKADYTEISLTYPIRLSK